MNPIMIIDQFFGLRLLISYSINQAVIRRLEDKRCLKETYGKNHDSHQITRNPDSYMYMSCVRKKYINDMQYYSTILCQIQYDMIPCDMFMSCF